MDPVITAGCLDFQMGAMSVETDSKDVQTYAMTMDDSWGNYRVVIVNVNLN